MGLAREGRLYGELAKHYDQIYHWKDYRKETHTIKSLIQKYKRSSGSTLLDVACGTGKHIQYLRDEFDCIGVDASQQMLDVARRNVPGGKFVRGNMVDFEMGRKFDVILCLFSSIGHLGTRKEVAMAVANFAHHLEEGGVLIIEPWLRKSDWKDGTVDLQTFDTDSLKIARVNFAQAMGKLTLLDERYLIAEKGKGTTYIRDSHRLRFFELRWTLNVMKRAGLDPIFTEKGLMPARGLLVATK
jgi:SAM-dependent methyltransferase